MFGRKKKTLYYNYSDAIEHIIENSNLPEVVVIEVLKWEEDYMVKQGIMETSGFYDSYLNRLTREK